MAYSAPSDLRHGDMPLAARYGDGSDFVNEAADTIDSYIGHIYVTPIELSDTSANRPVLLLLKQINNGLASGKLIMDIAISSEQDGLHAYGRRLYNDAMDLLQRIVRGALELGDAEKLPEAEINVGKNPRIYNEDPQSLVEGFYRGMRGGLPIAESYPGLPGRVTPYGP